MRIPVKVTRQTSIALLCAAMCWVVGCKTTNPNHPNYGMDHLPPTYESMPRELSKVVLPEYVIEPPDILNIEGVHIVPKSPYYLRTLDVLNIDAAGALPDAQITGPYPVGPGGIINLGAPYGTVKVAGMNVEQAHEAVVQHLTEYLRDPKVSVSLAQLAASQSIFGQFLVGPDGTITLGSYGQVSVVGKTLNQAKQDIEGHLSQHLERPEVSLNVFSYNSKVYYIVIQGAGLGDGVYRFPITGNETVLDAIAQIQGLEQVSSKKIWIARPSRTTGDVKILPVDWFAVTERGAAQTNYQILPGDRVFVAEDKLVAFDTQMAKLTAPLERIMGFVLLGTGTVTRLSGPVLRGGGNPNNNGI
jgi:polysaccharide export outer membrane protein